MQILVFNWQDIKHPLSGGAEIYLHKVFKRIAEKGHRVNWLGCSSNSLPEEEHYDNMHFYRKGKWEFANYAVPWLFLTKMRNNPFDIIIESVSKAPFYTPLYIKRKPTVVFVPHLFGRTIFQETNLFIASYVYSLERPLARIYRKKHFIVISESTQQDLIQRGIPQRNISIVYPGINSDKFHPTFEKENFPLILYLNRMKRYKRADFLLKAFKIVSEKKPESKLYLVGDGDYRPVLEKKAKELGLSKDRCRFLGFVSEQEKISLLQKAWVTVNVSPKEGWGMVNTEAQACGTPCLSFSSPGLKETILNGETGFLVPYGDIYKLADKIILILSDKDLRNRLSRHAVDWAKNFSWEKSSKKFLRILLQVYKRFPSQS